MYEYVCRQFCDSLFLCYCLVWFHGHDISWNVLSLMRTNRISNTHTWVTKKQKQVTKYEWNNWVSLKNRAVDPDVSQLSCFKMWIQFRRHKEGCTFFFLFCFCFIPFIYSFFSLLGIHTSLSSIQKKPASSHSVTEMAMSSGFTPISKCTNWNESNICANENGCAYGR